MRDVTLIGYTNWRNEGKPFGIKDADRLQHIYAIGKSGVGKSTLLLNMAVQDIQNGKGLAIIDPHNDTGNALLDYVPKHRINDVIYFNAADAEHPIAFNPLANVDTSNHHLAASALISTLRKVYTDSWGPRLEHILRFCLLTLLLQRGSTLLDVQPLLTDVDFRKSCLSRITNQYILAFWYNEFDKYSPALRAEAIAPILNKTSMFIASSPLRNIVGQPSSAFNIKDVMDSRKILVCNLSKGEIGEDACSVLGSLLLTSIQVAALSRASVSEDERQPFFLYVDEVQSFLTLSFADMLSEARKYGLSLFLTHQYMEQLDDRIRAAILGNVGTLISFRVGSADASYLEREFYPVFTEADLVNLPKFSIYLKLLISGIASRPFSATTYVKQHIAVSWRNSILEQSRNNYTLRPGTAVKVSQKPKINSQGGLFEGIS
jgi:hypothetical protein